MDKILSLFTSPIAVHPEYFNTLRLTLFSAIQNGTFSDLSEKITSETIQAKILSYPNFASKSVVDEWELTEPDLEDDSIAMFTMEGMIYPWKTYRLEQMVLKAIENPKIIGIIFFVNTPGGYTTRVDILSDIIKNSPKPTAVYVTGICASAGMFMFSGANKIFASSKMDVFGSIGVMTTFFDDSEYWKKLGIVETDIYATLSTLKSHEHREAEQGNFDPIIENLNYINTIFHQTISDNLGIAQDTENSVFKGATFYTKEAIQKGLAHEIKSLSESIEWVFEQGIKVSANNFYK